MNSPVTDYGIDAELLCLADTKLVLGNWFAECVLNGRSIPDFAAMLGICTASYGQTRALYRHLAAGQDNYARLERGRGPGEIASMELLDAPPQHWEDFVLTTWLTEQATWTLAAQLLDHPDRSISALARKIGEEAYFHLKYGTGWFGVFAADRDSVARLESALQTRAPSAYDWFTGDDGGRDGFRATIDDALAPLGLALPVLLPRDQTGFDKARRRRGDLPSGLFEVIRFKHPEYVH